MNYMSGVEGKTGLSYLETEAAKTEFDKLLPDKKAAAIRSAKAQIKVNQEYSRLAQDAINQLADQELISKENASYYSGYGDRNLARDIVADTRPEAKDEVGVYDAFNRLISGSVSTLNDGSKMYRFVNEKGEWGSPVKEADLPKYEKDALKYFTKEEGHYEGKLNLKDVIDWKNDFPTINTNMPIKGSGASDAGAHFRDMEGWKFGSQVVSKKAQDQYNKIINDRINTSSASTTSHAKKSNKINAKFGYSPTKKNVTSLALTKGDIVDQNGDKVSKDSMTAKFKVEFSEGKAADGVKEV